MAHRFLSFDSRALASAACFLLGVAAGEAQDWPSFRGPQAAGVSETAAPPTTWDIAAGRNVAWSLPVPGLGHFRPIVWKDRIFVTSAVPLPMPSEPPAGEAAATSDVGIDLREYKVVSSRGPQAWRLYCIDRTTGRILWFRTAHEGPPRVKRHAKASQASATPATDGTYVAALMGSEGLYVYDMEGELRWKHDLGRLDVGLVSDPSEEWSPASSPVIHDGLVIVQNDRHKDSYVAAFDVATGAPKWRVGRDELPSWSTPAVHVGRRPTLITNSPRFVRGHDPATGEELWRIADGTEVKVPTPIVSGDLVIVTGGYPTGGRPILAIRAATGDVVWKLERGSPYTTTPIVYQGVLYVIVDNGVLGAYDVNSGRRLYQRRLARDAGGFSASPVAAAGRVYFASEDGVLYVVRAGKTFEMLARNDMREMCLASPAISGDLLLVRTRTHLYALREGSAVNQRRPAPSS